MWQGKEGGGVNLAAATVGWVPVIGDAAKAAIKAGRKILVETARKAAGRAVRDNAGQLSRIVDPTTRQAVEQAIRDEALTKYAAREVEVGKQMDELAVQGHGPQRHGSHITERQLDDPAMHGIDRNLAAFYEVGKILPTGFVIYVILQTFAPRAARAILSGAFTPQSLNACNFDPPQRSCSL